MSIFVPPTVTGRQLHVTGVVQGVGFRPFVFALAQRFGLAGWVRNTSSGVDLALEGTPEALDAFTRAFYGELPPLARVDSVESLARPVNGYHRFEILASQVEAGAYQPISPDIAVCEDCLQEMGDPADRRYRYPFINCTNCGPRFTIIRDVPYDRQLTTMGAFPMCAACAGEYHDPRNRRFHAQPLACAVCGPHIWTEQPDGVVTAQGEAALREARRLLQEGQIVAIKGLGGFHLACDATSPTAVAELRRRKRRVDKPFALMVADLEALRRHGAPSSAEENLLSSSARPIVIVPRHSASTIARDVAPSQDFLGIMLPYTPLHHLLLERAPGFPDALVMTSGNLSEEPIVFTNEMARAQLASLVDGLLLHDRDIHTRCDDSVIRVVKCANDGEVIFPLRRSRGYAPLPVRLPSSGPLVLATGAELKNTFCVTRDDYAFLSQHIGDMENYETLRAFEQGVAHLEQLFRLRPEIIAHDLHPDYMSTRYALARAERDALPAIGVQHHHAHIAAGMVDNSLDGDQPVIGVAFDGTGYGPDGAIWGGEFLVADYCGFERPFHLRYVSLPGGDRAIREPWRVALAWLQAAGLSWDEDLAPVRFGRSLGDDHLNVLRVQLERGVNTPPTSSMGRLFDAAAALVGVRQVVNYEAQAAIELEALVDPDETGAYVFALEDSLIDPTGVWTALVTDLRAGEAVGRIAARLHNGLVHLTRTVCRKLRESYGLKLVVLSGGVWQNTILLQRAREALTADGFSVLAHQRVPPNDGGLSLGQAVVAACRQRH